MNCPTCGRKLHNLTGSQTRTLMGGNFKFIDEDDRLHIHDPNDVSDTVECGNGHRWHRHRKSMCPVGTCDWGADELRLIPV